MISLVSEDLQPPDSSVDTDCPSESKQGGKIQIWASSYFVMQSWYKKVKVGPFLVEKSDIGRHFSFIFVQKWRLWKKKCPTKFGKLKVGVPTWCVRKELQLKNGLLSWLLLRLLFESFATKVHLGIDVHTDEFTEIVVYVLAIQTSNCRWSKRGSTRVFDH